MSDYHDPHGPPPLPPAPAKKEGSKKYVLLAVGGCTLLILVAAGIGFFVYYMFRMTAEPVKIVNEHLSALRQGDVKKAYSFCSGAFRENTPLEEFQLFVRNYPILQKAEKFSSNNREVTSGVAKLVGSIHGTDGSNQPAEYHLVQEQKIWKIQQIQITYSGIVKREDAEPPPPSQQRNSPQPGTSGTAVKITEARVDAQPGQETTTVTLQFKVEGFANDKSGGTARVHLVQDLKTFDPEGNLLSDLSKEGIKELQESGQYQEYEFANFSNTLSIPHSYPRGKYRLHYIIYDRIGNNTTEGTSEFELK